MAKRKSRSLRQVQIRAHSRSPRGADRGKPRVRVRSHSRKRPKR